MSPKKKAKWMLGIDDGQTTSPFSTLNDAIAACDEIIKVFEDHLPPLTSRYWVDVREELRKYA